jgi:hypothetical protein
MWYEMTNILWATATTALFLPRRWASDQNFDPRKVRVLLTDHAASTRPAFNDALPL